MSWEIWVAVAVVTLQIMLVRLDILNIKKKLNELNRKRGEQK